MKKSRRISLGQIIFWYSTILFGVESFSNPSFQGQIQQHNFQIAPKELNRLRAKGLEISPGNSISSNSGTLDTISNEPSCEELRAMWRYYRRNARAAELTNQIPKLDLEDIFWGMASKPASFARLPGGSRSKFRPKAPNFGRLRLKPDKSLGLPRKQNSMDEIKSRLGMTQSPNNQKSDEPIILLSPPSEPTPKSNVDKVKEILQGDQIKNSRIGGGDETGDSEEKASNDQSYGRVVFSPPIGQDGRIANKPRELMTPFERIRFGHVDDLFKIDEDTPRRGLFSMVKRRRGFIALPMLKPTKPFWNSFGPNYHQRKSNRILSPPIPSNDFEDSIIIPQDSQNLLSSLPSSTFGIIPSGQSDSVNENNLDLPNILMFKNGDEEVSDKIRDESLPLVTVYKLNGPSSSEIEKITTVEERVQFCSEIKNQGCSVTSDCSCIGSALYRCHHGRCQTLQLEKSSPLSGIGQSSFGFWHSEPLEFSQLGIWEDTLSPPSGLPRLMMKSPLDMQRKQNVEQGSKGLIMG